MRFLKVALAVAVTLAMVSAARADIISNLLAHFKFEGNTNSTAGSVALGSATKTGIPYTYESGQIGQAIHFDGANDFFTFPGSASTAVALAGTSYTLSWRCNFDPAMEGSQRLFATDCATDASYAGGWGIVAGGSNIRWEAYPKPTGVMALGTNADQWYHMIAVYNSDTGYRDWFVDSVRGLSSSGNVDVAVDTDLHFGDYKLGGTQYFDGLLDEVRIYISVGALCHLCRGPLSTGILGFV